MDVLQKPQQPGREFECTFAFDSSCGLGLRRNSGTLQVDGRDSELRSSQVGQLLRSACPMNFALLGSSACRLAVNCIMVLHVNPERVVRSMHAVRRYVDGLVVARG